MQFGNSILVYKHVMQLFYHPPNAY